MIIDTYVCVIIGCAFTGFVIIVGLLWYGATDERRYMGSQPEDVKPFATQKETNHEDALGARAEPRVRGHG